MRASYKYNGKLYIFAWFQAEEPNKIIMVSDAGTDNERLVYIPVRDCTGYTIKINKKSISAIDGAYGLMKFFSDCIRQDIMTVWIEKTIRNFEGGQTA